MRPLFLSFSLLLFFRSMRTPLVKSAPADPYPHCGRTGFIGAEQISISSPWRIVALLRSLSRRFFASMLPFSPGFLHSLTSMPSIDVVPSTAVHRRSPRARKTPKTRPQQQLLSLRPLAQPSPLLRLFRLLPPAAHLGPCRRAESRPPSAARALRTATTALKRACSRRAAASSSRRSPAAPCRRSSSRRSSRSSPG